MDILTLNGWNITWTVRRVDAGDLRVSGVMHAGMSVIEFYDTAHKHTEFGQFVSCYDVETGECTKCID